MRTHFPQFMTILLMIGLAITGCTQKSASPEKIIPARLEEIDGSEYKRVILTEKAAERIEIQTALVSESMVSRLVTVGGEVVSSALIPVTGGSPLARGTVVQVKFNSGAQPVDTARPVMIKPLSDDEDFISLTGQWIELEDVDDGEDEDGDSYYIEIDGSEIQLEVGHRVFVDLPLQDANPQRKIIPYAALLYGVKGETWVYTNPEPLVYVRYPVVVDYIEGDQVILLEGPAAGTAVVTMGVAELYGAETGVSK